MWRKLNYIRNDVLGRVVMYGQDIWDSIHGCLEGCDDISEWYEMKWIEMIPVHAEIIEKES